MRAFVVPLYTTFQYSSTLVMEIDGNNAEAVFL